MSERCPLLLNRNYWDSEIPEICRHSCEEIWDEAIDAQPTDIDEFTRECGVGSECEHDIDNDGIDLQKIDDRKRSITVLNVCGMTGTELFSESYDFTCQNP